MRAQDRQRVEQEVAEIGRVERLEPLLICGIERATLSEREALRFAFGNINRLQPTILPAVDEGGKRPRGPTLLVDVRGFENLLHQAQLIVGVENGEIGFETGKLRIPAQHARADRMERTEPLHAFDHAADQIADALLHFARGLVGEGDGEHLPRPGAVRGEDVGKARGQHARLARARAGQNQHGAVDRQHGFALFGIEPCQIGRLARNRRPVRLLVERGVKGVKETIRFGHGQIALACHLLSPWASTICPNPGGDGPVLSTTSGILQ